MLKTHVIVPLSNFSDNILRIEASISYKNFGKRMSASKYLPLSAFISQVALSLSFSMTALPKPVIL